MKITDRMRKIILIALLGISLSLSSGAQKSSLIMLGDLHLAISVIRDRNYQVPSYMITKYGPSLAEDKPDWQPETLEARKAILAEEAKYITFYKQTDLPGYGILKINEKKGTVDLEYYAAFGRIPFDKLSLTDLMKE
jgi:hypothetical protein